MDFEKYMDYIDDAVVVINNMYDVISVNATFLQIFPDVKKSDYIKLHTEKHPEFDALLSEASTRRNVCINGRVYAVYVSPVYAGKSHAPAARSITLTDVTVYDQIAREAEAIGQILEKSNNDIKKHNAELMGKNEAKEKLARENENAILMRELHDTIGHSLTVQNGLNRLALMALPKWEESRDELIMAKHLAELTLVELDNLGQHTDGSIKAFLWKLKNSMSHVQLNVELEIYGEEQDLHSSLYIPLSRISQEAATNALRHGDADTLNISLTLTSAGASLHIWDNGKGAAVIEKGTGLTNMEERVKDMFGEIEFCIGDKDGFGVKVFLPMQE